MSAIPLIRVPTTIAVVDDEVPFLNALRYRMSGRYPLSLYSSARLAIASLRAEDQAPLDPKDLIGELVRERRMRETGVVVVDYQMGNRAMTGIALCRAVSGHSAKRIVLSGQMDQGAVIGAFNEGVIHRFVGKGDVDMHRSLVTYIEELSRARFLGVSLQIRDTSCFPAIHDTAFMEWLDDYWHARDLVGYAFHGNGFSFADRAGALEHMVVMRDAELVAWTGAVRSFQPPSLVIEELASRRRMPAVAQLPSLAPVGVGDRFWNDLLIPVQKTVLGDSGTYYLSFPEKLSGLPTLMDLGLDEYLNEMRARAIQ